MKILGLVAKKAEFSASHDPMSQVILAQNCLLVSPHLGETMLYESLNDLPCIFFYVLNMWVAFNDFYKDAH